MEPTGAPLRPKCREVSLHLKGVKAVVIEDPYIRLQHQIQKFVQFCETVLKAWHRHENLFDHQTRRQEPAGREPERCGS